MQNKLRSKMLANKNFAIGLEREFCENNVPPEERKR